MPRTAFIRELINTGPLAINPDYLQGLMPQILAYLKSGNADKIEFSPEKQLSFYGPYLSAISSALNGFGMPDQNEEPETVAVVPVHGALTKLGTWWDYGGDEIAEMISRSFDAENVKAVVLDLYTPGGSTHSIQSIKGVLSKRNKPVIAAVNTMAESAGYYIAAMADQIIAVDEMAEVGSIGVMAEIMNFDGFYEENKIQIHRIVPSLSKDKNAAFIKAREGDYTDYENEFLTPWAKHFQQHVTTYRKGLKQDADGVLTGKEFYAGDARDVGLIDDIMPMDDIIQLAFDRAKRDNAFSHAFNS